MDTYVTFGQKKFNITSYVVSCQAFQKKPAQLFFCKKGQKYVTKLWYNLFLVRWQVGELYHGNNRNFGPHYNCQYRRHRLSGTPGIQIGLFSFLNWFELPLLQRDIQFLSLCRTFECIDLDQYLKSCNLPKKSQNSGFFNNCTCSTYHVETNTFLFHHIRYLNHYPNHLGIHNQFLCIVDKSRSGLK